MTNLDEMLDNTVREMANGEPAAGFGQRMTARVWMACEPEARAGYVVAEALREEGLLASLWSGLQAVFFPDRLPALVLASRPMAVVDRMAGERDSRAMVWAVMAHVAMIVVIGFVVEARTGLIRTIVPVDTVVLDAPVPKALPSAVAMGGGGGQHGPTPVMHGRLPKFVEQQIVPPVVSALEEPKLAIDPTVEVQRELKMADNTMPNMGMPNSPLVGMSLGGGRGTGLGPGDGSGIGPGSGSNAGGGPRRVGRGVSEPEVLYQPEPEFSEEARRAKFSGDVMVYLWVDAKGNPTHVRVARSVGLGLDEKAVEAVKQYKFKPATENGKPVTVEMYVDVFFQVL